MKTLIKILFFVLILVLLSRCKKETDHFIIKDNNFLNALIELGVDKNEDGIISPEEAAQVNSINVNACGIADMKGIEAFVNLNSLWCGGNSLTSLDLSNNSALEFLSCSNSTLTSLDISNNTSLTNLYCDHNLLTRLDVSNNHALAALECEHNLFSLTRLDVSNNPELRFLWCNDNILASLDVSNNPKLQILDWRKNLLTTLEVSNSYNAGLIELYCDSNLLTSLDVSNSPALSNLSIAYNPSLAKVCVWTMPFPPTGVRIDKTGSPNVYFTMNCN